MSTRRTLGTLLALAVAGFGLAATPALAPAAHAVTGTPPVTTPDAVTVLQGNGAVVQPVNNDHDADNDVLAICRLGTEHYRGLSFDFFGNDWEVFARPSTKPGTYTFTYYACDFSYLTPGTITVTVEALPKISVKKIASQPGKLRVTNPAGFKIRFIYGSFKEDKPDGHVTIGKDSSAVIPVHRTRIDWIATNGPGDLFLGSGHVTGIKVARSAAGSTGRVSLPSRLAHLWRAA
jgi:Big-like domain-containing protein